MHKRPANVALPPPRQTKKRRRTATAVLAGYFDPRPQRDFFTDMANSSDSQSPYNSVVGHGPGILFDIRSQEEKELELIHEQKRLLKNAKRKERDIEKRRDKEEQKFRKAQRRLERIRETAQVNPAQRAGEETSVASATDTITVSTASYSGNNSPLMSLTRGGVAHAPREFPTGLSHLHTSPSSGWSPYYPLGTTTAASSSQIPLAYGGLTAGSPARSVQSAPHPHPGVSLAPSVPLVTMSAVPPSLLPASPPTPSRSVSSITSCTSSKRPRTPDDDEAPPACMHEDDHPVFDAYSSMDVDHDECILDPDSVRGTPGGKPPLHATPPRPEHPDRDPRPAIGPEVPPRNPNDIPHWFAAQSPQIDAHLRGAARYNPWRTTYSAPSANLTSNAVSPVPEHSPTPSISHRRSALSLAGLLSPISIPSVPLRVVPPAPPIPNNPLTLEVYIPEPRQTDPALNTTTDLLPESSVAAPSTVETSCLSPLAAASPLGGEAVPAAANDSPDQEIDEALVRPVHDPPLSALAVETEAKTDETPKANKADSDRLGSPIDLNSSVVSASLLALRVKEREESDTPEPDRRHRGRASKAIIVIHSEDELTDLEDLDTPLPLASKNVVKVKTDVARPASKHLPAGSVSASRDNTDTGDMLVFPESSESPAVSVVSAATKKRKRSAAKKGWKGWVEVEVEETALPPKRFTSDILPPGERRTRSGKQFDS